MSFKVDSQGIRYSNYRFVINDDKKNVVKNLLHWPDLQCLIEMTVKVYFRSCAPILVQAHGGLHPWFGITHILFCHTFDEWIGPKEHLSSITIFMKNSNSYFPNLFEVHF